MMDQNQLTTRTYMAIMAERDAAIQERDVALEERKRAFAERDMAMLQRDAAIGECNSALYERDEAIAALRMLESSLDRNIIAADIESRGMCNHIQEMDEILAEDSYITRTDLIHYAEAFNSAEVTSETANPEKVRPLNDSKLTKPVKCSRMVKRRAEVLAEPAFADASSNWGDSDDEQDRQPGIWKDNSRLNEIKFDDSVMPAPVCSCTGSPQPCYRWGNGGWQSACCTTNISMYPLPQVSNKRYTRVGGRKMSGSAFSKLLNRLASEGYDLSTPLDLKSHWAKHGTNRYTTVK